MLSFWDFFSVISSLSLTHLLRRLLFADWHLITVFCTPSFYYSLPSFLTKVLNDLCLLSSLIR